MRILYFAKLKQILDKSEDFYEITGDKEKIIEVINNLKKRDLKYSQAFDKLKNLQFAVNCQYVDSQYLVKNDDELAMFPPVTGG